MGALYLNDSLSSPALLIGKKEHCYSM